MYFSWEQFGTCFCSSKRKKRLHTLKNLLINVFKIFIPDISKKSDWCTEMQNWLFKNSGFEKMAKMSSNWLKIGSKSQRKSVQKLFLFLQNFNAFLFPAIFSPKKLKIIGLPSQKNLQNLLQKALKSHSNLTVLSKKNVSNFFLQFDRKIKITVLSMHELNNNWDRVTWWVKSARIFKLS